MNLSLLIILYFIICIILLITIIINSEKILFIIHIKCNYLKKFILLHNGFFTIGFIIIFLSEQVTLILVIYFSNVSSWLSMFIGLFALCVITTASLQKFIWQFKFTSAQQKVQKVSIENNQKLNFMKKIINEKIYLNEENFKLKKQLKKAKRER